MRWLQENVAYLKWRRRRERRKRSTNCSTETKKIYLNFVSSGMCYCLITCASKHVLNSLEPWSFRAGNHNHLAQPAHSTDEETKGQWGAWLRSWRKLQQSQHWDLGSLSTHSVLLCPQKIWEGGAWSNWFDIWFIESWNFEVFSSGKSMVVKVRKCLAQTLK